MTKITVIGESPKEEKKLKPIEFIGCIHDDGISINLDISLKPSDFEKIRVIKVKDYKFDCLCICSHKQGFESTYTANFNDGVAE